MTRAEIEAIACHAAKTVVREVLREHVRTCPMQYKLQIQWWKLMALLAISGTLGGGVGALGIKLGLGGGG